MSVDLNATTAATDPFVMQYADGFPLEDVAWGRLSLDTLSQQTRLNVLQINIAMRPPYINRVQSSNAASHVLRSMIQAVSGSDLPGAFGNAKSRVLVIISSDYYVAGLAGLLGLHWHCPAINRTFALRVERSFSNCDSRKKQKSILFASSTPHKPSINCAI